jgi:hypothetical protein
MSFELDSFASSGTAHCKQTSESPGQNEIGEDETPFQDQLGDTFESNMQRPPVYFIGVIRHTRMCPKEQSEELIDFHLDKREQKPEKACMCQKGKESRKTEEQK